MVGNSQLAHVGLWKTALPPSLGCKTATSPSELQGTLYTSCSARISRGRMANLSSRVPSTVLPAVFCSGVLNPAARERKRKQSTLSVSPAHVEQPQALSPPPPHDHRGPCHPPQHHFAFAKVLALFLRVPQGTKISSPASLFTPKLL